MKVGCINVDGVDAAKNWRRRISGNDDVDAVREGGGREAENQSMGGGRGEGRRTEGRRGNDDVDAELLMLREGGGRAREKDGGGGGA